MKKGVLKKRDGRERHVYVVLRITRYDKDILCFFKYSDKPVYPNSAVHLIQMTVDIF
jgi:hypothetical protein